MAAVVRAPPASSCASVAVASRIGTRPGACAGGRTWRAGSATVEPPAWPRAAPSGRDEGRRARIRNQKLNFAPSWNVRGFVPPRSPVTRAGRMPDADATRRPGLHASWLAARWWSATVAGPRRAPATGQPRGGSRRAGAEARAGETGLRVHVTVNVHGLARRGYENAPRLSTAALPDPAPAGSSPPRQSRRRATVAAPRRTSAKNAVIARRPGSRPAGTAAGAPGPGVRHAAPRRKRPPAAARWPTVRARSRGKIRGAGRGGRNRASGQPQSPEGRVGAGRPPAAEPANHTARPPARPPTWRERRRRPGRDAPARRLARPEGPARRARRRRPGACDVLCETTD
jgi:hypothetical protein